MYEMYNVEGKVNVYLNDADLEPYGVTAKELYSGKSFKGNLIDDLMKDASNRYGKKYKFGDGNVKIIPYGICAIVSFE